MRAHAAASALAPGEPMVKCGACCVLGLGAQARRDAELFLRSKLEDGRLRPVCKRCSLAKPFATLDKVALEEGMDEYLVQEIQRS